MGAIAKSELDPSGSGAGTAAVLERLGALERALGDQSSTRIAVDAKQPEALALIVFSGSLDRMLAAFTIATGAAAMGMRTTMFFTFWATAALRKRRSRSAKGPIARLFGWLLPSGSRALPLSQLNFAGGGPLLMRHLMKKKGAASVEEMLGLSADLGVQIRVCTTSMDLLGFDPSEMIDYPGLDYCGVAKFLEIAAAGRVSLFV